MKVSVLYCWLCEKKLGDRPMSCFFWCCDEHRDTYNNKVDKAFKARMNDTSHVVSDTSVIEVVKVEPEPKKRKKKKTKRVHKMKLDNSKKK